MNTEFKGTPGPWTWAGITQIATGRGHYFIIPSNSQSPEDAIAKSSFDGMRKEDAILIAASPELFEALQKTQEILGPLTLSDVSNSLPEAAIQFAENQKLIQRISQNIK